MHLLLYNLNIVDIINGAIIKDTSLLISNGIISKIGKFNPNIEMVKIDCRSSWAMPSFVDMHAHITFDGRAYQPTYNFEYNECNSISLYRGAQNLFEALLSGVCLIRDVGGKGARSKIIKDMVDSGKVLGPDLVLSGEPICRNNGHGYEFGRNFHSQSELRDLIIKHKEEGYEWLKIMNGPEMFELKLLNKMVEIAHEKKLKVSIHAFTEEGIQNAIISKADTIEHAVVFNEQLSNIAKENSSIFVPTFYCSWLSLREDFITSIPDKEIKYLIEWHEFIKKHFKYHIDCGLPVCAGTDAGSAPCIFSDIVNEIKMFNYYGLTPIESIKSGTLIPAIILGRDDKYGSIDEGKLANIVLLSKNPLLDINALDEIVSIWFKGIEIFNRGNKPWN